LENLQSLLSPSCNVELLNPLELLDRSGPAGLSDAGRERIQDMLTRSGSNYIAGWSLGGMLAILIASLFGPRVSGLCLVSTTLKFCRDSTRNWAADPRRVMAMRDGLTQRPANTLKAFLHLAARPARPLYAISEDQRAGIGNHEVEALCTGLDFLLQADLRSCDFARFPDTAVLHGGRDSIIPVEAGKEIRSTIQGAHFDEIPDIGHDLAIRCPEILVENLTRLMGVR